jgi:hypothetical protein
VSLRAPIAVTVEVRAAGRRVFRLAANVGEDGLTLERPAPFEIGRPVELWFAMPDGVDRLALPARVEESEQDQEEAERDDRDRRGEGGRELTFLKVSDEHREILRRYIVGRLGLSEGAA